MTQPFAGKWRQRCARIRAAADLWRAALNDPLPPRRPIARRQFRNQQKGLISETTGPAASPRS